MPSQPPKQQLEEEEAARQKEQAAQKLHETLEQTGQLVDVHEGQDTSKLPAKVTYVRYPNGTVKRIRFTGPGYY